MTTNDFTKANIRRQPNQINNEQSAWVLLVAQIRNIILCSCNKSFKIIINAEVFNTKIPPIAENPSNDDWIQDNVTDHLSTCQLRACLVANFVQLLIMYCLVVLQVHDVPTSVYFS